MAPPGDVLVSGATGLVGSRLCARLRERGDGVRALSRRPERAAHEDHSGVQWLGWDGTNVERVQLAGAAAVVHLAGEPIFAGRLTAERRRRIRESRIDSTRSLVRTLDALEASERPATLVCASAVGVYGSRGDEELDEDSPPGDGFLADVCRDWEAAARGAEACGVRVVSLRIGIVLSRHGGALPMMALPFRFGLGGRLGDGRQWFPWVHLEDVVGLIERALDEPSWHGAVNASAPQPVRNAELTRTLARVLSRPALLPVPAFAVKLALGELAGELLGSRRVLPRRALEAGYAFAHSALEPALRAELDG